WGPVRCSRGSAPLRLQLPRGFRRAPRTPSAGIAPLGASLPQLFRGGVWYLPAPRAGPQFLQIGAQAEEAARRLDVECLGRVGAVAAERRERGVQDLVDDRLRQALERLALPRVERAERRQAAFDLVPAYRLHPLAQRDDGGHDVEVRVPAPERVDLGVHDGFCPGGLARAGAAVLGDHALQVVDVVEVDVVELVRGRIEGAR